MKTPLLLAILLTLPLVFALSFISNPQINSGLPVFTDENLVCEWTLSGDTTSQNITFYQGGTPVITREETGPGLNSSYTLLQGNTTKNEEWICSVRISNGTTTEEQNTTVTIQNSAPETPVVYDSLDQNIGTTFTVTEDTTYAFDVNSSDVDQDTLEYLFVGSDGEFCSMTNSATGAVSCTPQQADHSGSATDVNITFSVRDDDNLFKKTSSLKVTFTVLPLNDAPESALTNQETPVNETLSYDFDATDEEDNFPLNFTIYDAPAEIADKLTIIELDDDTARIIYDATTPDFNDVNITGWNITINTTDDDGASSLNSFLLNITAVGRAPQIETLTPTGPYVLNQGDSIEINVTATDADSDEIHTFTDDSGIGNFATTTTQAFNNVTGNTTATIEFNASNDEVGGFTVTVTVTDKELLTDTVDINFTVINVNDPPTISEISTYETNTQENTNSSNITAYVDSALSFRMNATDIDEQYGDTLSYSDNTTLFDIDSNGIISFTPNASEIGTYSINITATDNQSANASQIITLTINPNTAPRFTATPLPNATCSENVLCVYNLSDYATDIDGGDSIIQFTAEVNITSFAYNQTTGIINFTPEQAEIGNYIINITIEDSRGATNETTLLLEVNNTPETPTLTRYDFSSRTIVETYSFTYQLQAEDNDILLGDAVNFSTNISFIDIGAVSTNNNRSSALLSFTPNVSHVGDHSINITASDDTGRQASEIFTFTVLAKTEAPVILAIQPWGNVSASNAPVESFNTTTQGNSTTLTFNENSSYLFAHDTEDDVTPDNQLNTTWYYDGVEVATSWNYSRSFDFFSSGSHTLELVVNDTTFESTTYTWNLNIVNVNRPPELINDLDEPIVINTTVSYGDYFRNFENLQRFYDPDDDLNSNGNTTDSETNTLTFTATACTSGALSIATISITDDDLAIIPQNVGSCSIVFTATDPSGVDAVSNSVTINITDVPETSEEPTTTTSSSGGGGSSSRSSFIPITTESESPEPLNILAPKLVDIYENNSVIIPFEVKNTWNENLEFVELSANTNATGVETTLSSNMIETLRVNETREVLLTISNYRLGENYEVEIVAAVDDPEFEDSALVLLNSIEQASDGDEAEIKVTFAQDLLNEHPECQELNELLDQAQQELSRGNFAEANRYVDGAINGCRYIVSTLTQNTERPDSLSNLITLDEVTLQILLYASLAFMVLITMAFILYYHYTSREEDDI